MTAARMGKAKARPKLTRWFSIGKDGQPVREGWYDARFAGDRANDYRSIHFQDGYWSTRPGGPRSTFGNMNSFPDDKWRGLVADPTKAGA